jgi:hypothetical protein
MPSSSHILDRLAVTFDDDHAVADAGLVLPRRCWNTSMSRPPPTRS